MRRASTVLFAAVALASLALGIAPAGVLAKGEPMGVRLDSDVKNLRAGEAFDLTFTVLARPAAQRLHEPAVWISQPAAEPVQYFTARPTGKPGQYRARVTLPTAGRWIYTVGERRGRFFDFAPVVAGAPAGGKRSAMLGATPFAALGLVAALGCAALVRRRRAAG
jgi:hypothetical protein